MLRGGGGTEEALHKPGMEGLPENHNSHQLFVETLENVHTTNSSLSTKGQKSRSMSNSKSRPKLLPGFLLY